MNRGVIRTLTLQLAAKDIEIKRLTEIIAGMAGVPVDRPIPTFAELDAYRNTNPDQINDPEQELY